MVSFFIWLDVEWRSRTGIAWDAGCSGGEMSIARTFVPYLPPRAQRTFFLFKQSASQISGLKAC
jgi:hypothetical protein